MNIFDAIREGQEERVSSLTRGDPTLLEKAEEGGEGTPLLVAVEHGRVGMVKLLLTGGATIDGAGREGETALMRAITKGNEEMVSLLLGHGAKVDLADEAGNTSLMWASMRGHLGLVKLVFEAMLEKGLGTDLDRTGEDGKTALHYAAAGGHFDVVVYLLCNEAQTHIKDGLGMTPLMLACEKGPLESVQILVLLGGKKRKGLEEEDIGGWSALHHAAYRGDKAVVTFLLRKGAQASTRDHENGTPLMVAIVRGHVEVAQVLLEAPGGLEGLEEIGGSEGRTVLHYAAQNGNKELVKLLLSKGAQASSRDSIGATPFMLACWEGHVEVAQMLSEATEGHDLAEVDQEGWMAMHYAADGGHMGSVAFLLGEGAQASVTNNDDTTPLMLACRRESLESVQLLFEATKGQGLEDRNKGGWRAISYAATGGYKEIAAFLLGKGAQASVRNNHDVTPFMLACESGILEVVQMLFEATEGQGLEEVDRHGKTPMHWAVSGGRGATEVVKYLCRKGAKVHTGNTRGQETPLMLALRHTEGHGINERDSQGKTALHLALGYRDRISCEVAKALLLAGADLSIADNEGRTPRQVMEQDNQRGTCRDLLQWWDGELERPYVLYRARCLHDVSTRQHTAPAAPVPGYLSGRVAGGCALPRVDVKGEKECKTKRKRTQDGQGEEEKEGEAVRGFVVAGLNEELLTELLEGFHGFKR